MKKRHSAHQKSCSDKMKKHEKKEMKLIGKLSKMHKGKNYAK